MDNDTRAFFVKLIQANPGATDEELRKAYLTKSEPARWGMLSIHGIWWMTR
jgi:hypothetical protein